MKFNITWAGLIVMAIMASAHATEGDSARAQPINRNPQAAHQPVKIVKPVAKGSDFIGKAVINPQGEALGEIIDLAVSGAQGRVIYAVLGSGGFLGIGQDLHAIPLGAFRKAANGDDLVLDVSKSRLDAQAGFDEDHWPAQASDQLVARSVPFEATRRDAGPQRPAVTKFDNKIVR